MWMKLKVFSSTVLNVSDLDCFYQAIESKSQECRGVFIYVFLEYLIEPISCVELN